MLRATLKSLLAHKLRLVLSAIAVTLGVAFVAGSFVFTDTIRKTFDDLLNQTSADVTVSPKPATGGDIFDSAQAAATLPASVVDTVAAVDGVANAHGDIYSEGVNLLNAEGKVVGSTNGAPGIGTDWWQHPSSPMNLIDGRGPAAPDEIAIDSSTAKKGDYSPGDSTRLLMPTGPPRDAKIVGIFRFGSSGGLAGATLTAFEPATAQKLLGKPGQYSNVLVTAEDGVSQDELKRRISAVIPPTTQAKTQKETADEAGKAIGQFLGYFNTLLLAFAAVALFVGTFIILNTFSMIVAQRTRELALLRAVGASRAQVRRSMLIEALIVGLVGSLVGIGLGIGLAVGLKAVFKAVGAEIETGPLVIAPRTIIISLLVGVVVTVVAAYFPARRAAKVPPIAALREVSAAPRSLRPRGILGGVLTAIGAFLLVSAVTNDDGSTAASLLGLGVLLTMVGVIVLAPLLGLPIVKLLGAPFRAGFGTVGRLSTDNAERNPRRTAATASALMIGLALVSAFGVLAASISASIDDVVERQLGADYIVSNGAQMPFSDDVAKRAAAVEGVESVVRQRFANAKINNDKTFALATDTKALTDAVKIEFIQGDAAALTGDAMIIDEPTAEAKKLAVGDTVDFTMVGGTKKVSIAGIYKPAQFLGPYVVTMPTYDALGGLQRDSFVYVNLKEGADAAVAGPALETALKDYPTVNLQDQTAFKEDQQGQVDQLLLLIYALLFLAIVIAVLGIINTLALSVIERTREIGLLRAIGLNRPQLRRMVTLESVVIALLGAVLGMVLGLVFGTAMQKVLSGQGIEQLAIPYGRLVIFMVVAAVIGVLAALWPAYRASKLDVLKAITTE